VFSGEIVLENRAKKSYRGGIKSGAAQSMEVQGKAWFCLRTQIKHERLAAAHLRMMEEVEVLFPRMSFTRKRMGAVKQVTEPLFPNYLFARFNPRYSLARVRHAHGVQTVVHFGNRLPVIPDSVIQEIRQSLTPEEVCHVETSLAPGDTVGICSGAFTGLQAVITSYVPRKQRVTLLLDFLGRQVNFEVSENEVTKERVHPLTKMG
jgi:transcriptional antiterminator RfaH